MSTTANGLVPQTIDVTGLPPDAVKAVTDVVQAFRGRLATPPDGPPPNETAEQWVARFTAHCAAQKPVTWFVDDSRESIYEENGE